MQKRFHVMSWSEEKCRGCNKEGTEKHRLYHLLVSEGGQKTQILEQLGNWEQKAKTSKNDWTWQRGVASSERSSLEEKSSDS